MLPQYFLILLAFFTYIIIKCFYFFNGFSILLVNFQLCLFIIKLYSRHDPRYKSTELMFLNGDDLSLIVSWFSSVSNKYYLL